jgi:hypothetical protein
MLRCAWALVSALVAAVGQRDFLRDEPDHVGGELGDLIGIERNAGAQVPLPGVGQARVHQGHVLFFVTAVVAQEAVAGERHDLVTDELLFIKAVAQALLCGGGVEVQSTEHVVAAQPGAVVGKLGVGLDQVFGTGLGVLAVQAASGHAARTLLP